jgi:hypothetical protein
MMKASENVFLNNRRFAKKSIITFLAATFLLVSPVLADWVPGNTPGRYTITRVYYNGKSASVVFRVAEYPNTDFITPTSGLDLDGKKGLLSLLLTAYSTGQTIQILLCESNAADNNNNTPVSGGVNYFSALRLGN